jgi:hypothetical protein
MKMIKIKFTTKENKGPAPYGAKGSRSGFVILFAVTISAILLAIALGVANIAFKEVRFGTSARDSNDAFFAADTGAECALINDKYSAHSFVSSGGSGTVSCLGGTISLSGAYPAWTFVVGGLGSSGNGCAKVSVTKDTTIPTAIRTTVVSTGYNIGDFSACASSSQNRTAREVKVTY